MSLSATDNVGVTRVELYIDGVLYGESASSSASFSWETTNTTDGSYSLEARAYDAANNVGSTTITVNVQNSVVEDGIAPLVSITSPTDGAKLSGGLEKVSVSSSDNIGVTKVELYINGALFGTSTSDSPTFNWNIRRIASGAHTLQAYAYDAAGNIGASHLVTVYK